MIPGLAETGGSLSARLGWYIMRSRPEKTVQGELASEFMSTDSHASLALALSGGNDKR